MYRVTRVGHAVRKFYEGCSFPGYEDCETPWDLLEKAKRGAYAELLDEQLPLGAKILDVGCGTGQLAIFLSMANRKVLGIDFSFNSIKKANDFKGRFRIRNVQFAQMDVLNLALGDECFDYVFCNGVLHHTADAYRGFQGLCRVVKKGGYIVVGLYNTYGRMMLNLRKRIFNMTGGKLKWLDYYMRQRSLGEEKKHIWYMDQYQNPHEDVFTVGDVLKWFSSSGVEFVNSIPKISLGEKFTRREKLFEKHDAVTKFDHLVCQLGWILTQGREGGFFVMIGRKM